jgi:hypothetical protein
MGRKVKEYVLKCEDSVRGILLNFLRSWRLELTDGVSELEVDGDEESVS